MDGRRAAGPQQIDRTLAQFAHQAIRFDHLVTRRAAAPLRRRAHAHAVELDPRPRRRLLRASVEQALMSEVPGLRASIQLLPLDVEAHFGDQKDLL